MKSFNQLQKMSITELKGEVKESRRKQNTSKSYSERVQLQKLEDRCDFIIDEKLTNAKHCIPNNLPKKKDKSFWNGYWVGKKSKK